jgi:hypothetical protein
MKRLAVALVCALICLLALQWSEADAAELVVDNTLAPNDCRDGMTPYTTVQSAVDAASAFDTVAVCPGTYVEQVTVETITGHNLDGLVIEAADPMSPPTIQAPAVMVGKKAVIYVRSAAGVAIRDLVISGPGGGSCDSIRYGIFVGGTQSSIGSANIYDNQINSIRDSVPGSALSGCQNGIGVGVGRAADSEVGRVDEMIGNSITDYQKGGILVDGPDSSAAIIDNIVTGAGKTTIIGQNGIQVSRGAIAAIRDNTVTANFYDNGKEKPSCLSPQPGGGPANSPAGSCVVTATGILKFETDETYPSIAGDLQSQNTLRHNQINVVVIK